MISSIGTKCRFLIEKVKKLFFVIWCWCRVNSDMLTFFAVVIACGTLILSSEALTIVYVGRLSRKLITFLAPKEEKIEIERSPLGRLFRFVLNRIWSKHPGKAIAFVVFLTAYIVVFNFEAIWCNIIHPHFFAENFMDKRHPFVFDFKPWPK